MLGLQQLWSDAKPNRKPYEYVHCTRDRLGGSEISGNRMSDAYFLIIIVGLS